MQPVRSLLLFIMLMVLIAAGYFVSSAQSGMLAAMAISYLLLSGFLVLVETADRESAGGWIEEARQWAGRYTGAVLLGGAIFFAVIGQVFIIQALVTTQLAESQADFFTGLGVTVAGLLLLLWFLAQKKQKMIFSAIHPYRLLFFLTVLGAVTWLGMVISQSSLDLGPDGRYFCLFDDAMISLKYAWNLTHGLGLVWNPGERVEGYTNLLMVLYMSIGTMVLDKNMSVLFVQISGAVFLLLIGVLHAKIMSRVINPEAGERKKLYLLLGFLSPILYYPLTYWSVMGMETGLLCLLMTFSVYLVIAERDQPRFNPWLALALGLMTLVRPDAMIQVALIFLYRLVTILLTRANVMTIIYEGLLFILLPLGQLTFRWFYYHALYPNTYLLKIVGYELSDRLVNGKKFMLLFFQSAWPVTLVSIISVLLKFKKEKLLFLMLFLSVSAYQWYVGGDPWPYWRIMAPYIGLLLLASIDLIETIIQLMTRTLPNSKQAWLKRMGSYQAVALLLWFMLLLGLNGKFLSEIYFQERPYSVLYNLSNVQTGLHLKRVCKPTARVGVTWAGTIPYYSGLAAVDFLGKCDPYIASLPADPSFIPGHNKYDLNYSIGKLKPDYIQTHFWQGDDLRTFVEEHYVFIGNRWYLKDSEHIKWNKLKKTF